MSYPVKYFMSNWSGAPRCSGTPGDMIALLDACLINGFGLLTVQTLTVTGGVATADFGTTHGFLAGQIVLISGAAPAALSGEHYVQSVTATTLTFADFTGVTDGPATGAISCKIAPVGGWSKAFSATQKAAYRSDDVQGTRLYLLVDDTGDVRASVRGYEEMSDMDNGIGPFPAMSQREAYYWYKSTTANATARTWALIGDGRLFYLCVGAYSNDLDVYVFGDIISYKPADAYHCRLEGSYASSASPAGSSNFARLSMDYSYAYLARSHTQIGSAVSSGKIGNGAQSYIGYGGCTYPNPADNGLLLHRPVLATESSGIRGEMPGLLQPIQDRPLANGDIIADIEQLPGRRVLILSSAPYISNTQGRAALDITGPWR